ncbi:MAG TPA: energy transducer TonB [Chryseosolibacter sp.]|nr:energy transducer TonB [Chryseosolibacter sp.]
MTIARLLRIVSCAFACVVVVYPQKAHSQEAADSVVIYDEVDVFPEFPGGMKALGKIVDGKKNHRYPEEARKNNIEGKVVIQFVIHEDGTPGDFEVVEGIGYGCDEAAVDAFKKMPKWKPGLLDGKPVKVRMKMAYLYGL